MSKETHLEKAMQWVSKRNTLSIKSRFSNDDYDATQVFVSKNSDKTIQPDISFVSSEGTRSYLEIAIKTEDAESLVTRWKLLSTMASIKRGKLYILTPRGHKVFTQKLVEQHNIKASIYSI